MSMGYVRISYSNKKSNTRFRLVPKSTTLGLVDPEMTLDGKTFCTHAFTSASLTIGEVCLGGYPPPPPPPPPHSPPNAVSRKSSKLPRNESLDGV